MSCQDMIETNARPPEAFFCMPAGGNNVGELMGAINAPKVPHCARHLIPEKASTDSIA